MRRFLLVVALFGASLTALHRPTPTAAAAGTRTLLGQVVTVSGPASNPTGFSLQTVTRLVPIRIAPTVRFLPRSAEAAVEGFGVGDYALVVVSGPATDVSAQTVRFDVQPLPSMKRFPVVGTVLHEAPNGKQFVLRTENSRTWQMRITAKTTFLSAGVTLVGPQTLFRGERVSVIAHNQLAKTVALQIDVNPATV